LIFQENIEMLNLPMKHGKYIILLTIINININKKKKTKRGGAF
jgi:hypothetical protein